MLITLLALAVLVIGAIAVTGTLVSRIPTIFPGIEVQGVPLEGLTKDEAAEALRALGEERYDGYAVTAELPLENSLTVTAEEVGVTWDAAAQAEEAWNYGRDGGFVENLITYAKARYLHRTDFSGGTDLEVSLDEDALRAIVHTAAEDIDEQLLESGIEITDTEIRLMKGASGLVLDEDYIFNSFREAILAADATGFVYESDPDLDDAYDFQTLYDQLHAEVKEAEILYAPEYETMLLGGTTGEKTDEETGEVAAAAAAEKTEIHDRAWFTDTGIEGDAPLRNSIAREEDHIDFNGQPFMITESVTGVTFDVDEANALWAAAGYGEEVVVPITTTRPAHTTADVSDLLFGANLSKNWTMVRLWNREYCEEVRTSLAGSSKNRISNVKKACDALNGMVLLPGEIFSYNNSIGERTAENGWLPAPAYADGEVKQENGGGICQVSSTLYNAALYSNMEIVERECHYFQVGYLPWGMDATVSWGWPDFRFRNNNPYPIMIVAWVDDATNECCVQIKGTDVDHTYVIMKFNNWRIFDETDTYHDAKGNALAVGMAAATWRLVFHDGDDYTTATPISETYEVYSTYHYHTEDIEAKNVPLGGSSGDEG